MAEPKKLPQYIAALSAAGGAFAAGTILGWSNPVQLPLTSGDYGFSVDKNEFSWIGSAMTLGAFFTCVPIGSLIHITGRKLMLLLLIIPFTLGWGLITFASQIEMMYAGRFFLGIACAGTCVAAPMYTGEIAHKDIRGMLGSFFQLLITMGILFVYAAGAGLDVFGLSLLCLCFPVIVFIIFLFMPESPVYLISKNKPENAAKSMAWLRGKDYDSNGELNEMKAATASSESDESLGKVLCGKAGLKSLCIGMGLMFFQQLCGINAVIFYSTDIFKDAKTGLDEKLSTIIIGVMQVIATFISTMIVDKIGRRILLTLSALLMALSTVTMGFYFFKQQRDAESVEGIGWLPVTALCLFIIMFSMGFGPVPWIMNGEIFAPRIKGIGGALSVTLNWGLAFAVTKTFVNVKDAIGSGETFWLFAGITVLGAIFVMLVVPETKGKTLNQIQDELAGKA